jgi:nucleoside-diphosphate-sugar epimerase
MKILMTGATGFIGKHLLSKLKNDVIIYKGSIMKKDDMEKYFPVDIVYHLAAVLDESHTLLWHINVDGTRNVAELCKKYNAKMIYLSSSGVLGETIEPAKENAPYNPETRYEESKAEAEKIIINSGINYTIIRAPVIIGPNEIWLKIFQRIGKMPVIGSGENKFHLAYIDDVIDLLIFVREKKAADKQIYHIATVDVPTYLDVYRMIRKELRINSEEKHIKIYLAYAMSFLDSLYCRLTGKKQDVFFMKSSIRRIVRNRILSTEKLKEIGFKPKYDSKKALKDTINYFRKEEMIG